MRVMVVVLAFLLAAPVMAADTVQYRYDALGRLIGSDQRVSRGNGSRTVYGYDPASNRSKVTATGAFKPVQLAAGMDLRAGQGVLSSDTRFLLLFQTDGNLVLFDQNMTALWASNTGGQGATQAIMQGDGNFVIYRGGTPLWHTGTNGSGARRLTVQTDGNVVIYTDSSVPVWNSGTCCR